MTAGAQPFAGSLSSARHATESVAPGRPRNRVKNAVTGSAGLAGSKYAHLAIQTKIFSRKGAKAQRR